MSRHAADIRAVMGATGSGKSAYVKYTMLRRPPARLLIWDFKREYGEIAEPVETISQLVHRVRGQRQFALRLLPTMEPKLREQQFDWFCRIALDLGRVTVLVEELAFVTRPSYAPSAWSMITCTGRHEALAVIGTSQRPAQIDKNFLGNATLVHCGRLNYQDDAQVMAKVLWVPVEEILALADLEFLQRDVRSRRNTRGVVRLPGPG